MYEPKRLPPQEERDAIEAFVEHQGRLGVDVYIEGCTVIYRDDYDAGASQYQVVDPQGHADGSGNWHEVE